MDENQPDWSEIGELTLGLQRHTQIFPQIYRGQRWYVLHDDSSAINLRFNESAYAFIGRLNGVLTVEENWMSVQAKLGDDAPTQSEIVMILAQLLSVGALSGNVSPRLRTFFEQFQSSSKQQKKINPLALRFPLFDPDRLLNHVIVLVRPLFSRTFMAIWSLVVAFGCLLAMLNYSSLAGALSMDMLQPDNLFVIAVLYVAIKLVHEFAHAITVKYWGGEVHEMGITLLVMVPVPHVDATAAWAFRDKHKRVLVSAAGIMAELFVASIALFVWLAVEPGMVQESALNIAVIGSVSTLVFNANPLLRFDGYYMLQDSVEVPNLGTRSNRYYFYLIQRYLFGLEQAQSPQTADGEHIVFAWYAPAAFLWRLVVTATIVFFLIDEYMLVGVALAAWALSSMMVVPVVRGLLFVVKGSALAEQRRRAIGVSLAVASLVILVTCFVPVSLTTRANGVVWVPDQAGVFVETEGFVEQLMVSSGDTIKVGDVLVRMRNPELRARIAVAQAQKKELFLINNAEWRSDRVKSQITLTALETLEAELVLLKEQAENLTIRSQVAGTVVLLVESGLDGLYLQQGQLLGYVSKQDRLIVRSVVTQSDIGLLRRNVASVEVRLAENLGKAISAKVIRETPSASADLPSAALGTLGGGNIAVDQLSEKRSARRAVEKLFQVDLALSPGVAVAGLGERAYILFDHGSEPLADQWLRAGRQLILSRLSL